MKMVYDLFSKNYGIIAEVAAWILILAVISIIMLKLVRKILPENFYSVKDFFRKVRYKLLVTYNETSFLAKNATVNYLNHFGWLSLLILAILIISFIHLFEYFHWIFISVIGLLFLSSPMKFVYSLVGGRNSLRLFFVLFIFTQLVFSVIYYRQFHKAFENSGDEIHNQIYYEQYSTKRVIQNTIFTSLSQGISPLFDDFLSEYKGTNSCDKVLTIINIQIFISWLYLGVLIASLYQKISNR